MLKALVIKELRESAGIAALAVLGLLFAYMDLTGSRLLSWQARNPMAYPFLYDSLSFYLCVFVGGLAIALGLRQTVWETNQGTFFFLLHRPMNRNRVFASKLVVGLVWVLATSAILLVLYAWWASRPGHVAAPFEWSMTMSAWQKWAALPVVYFGAFFSGIRPARWWGTRLVPLVAAIFIASFAANMPWFWLTLLLSIVFSTLYVIGLLYFVRARDY
jgi:hypothetical protein